MPTGSWTTWKCANVWLQNFWRSWRAVNLAINPLTEEFGHILRQIVWNNKTCRNCQTEPLFFAKPRTYDIKKHNQNHFWIFFNSPFSTDGHRQKRTLDPLALTKTVIPQPKWTTERAGICSQSGHRRSSSFRTFSGVRVKVRFRNGRAGMKAVNSEMMWNF